MRFEILTASSMKMRIFWDIAMNHFDDGRSTHVWNVGIL
jgi:hypothetical protein